MREIKFRAWHTKQKKMYPCSELVADQMTLLPDGRFINVSGSAVWKSQIDNNQTMIPLQYTGLKDKNGKEIYEGDIVKVWSYKSDYWDEAEMIEENHPQKISWFYESHFPHWTLEDLYLDGLQYVGHFDKLEVIGNIYENPELTPLH